MTLINHRFLNHKINPNTEYLIIGTFNPDTENNTADFFYGRPRNYLWTLIPRSFGENDLKGKSKSEKIAFCSNRKIDFIDLISQVNVDDVINYYDDYLDDKVTEWKNLISEIEKLTNIKKVGFTRKTFSGIPNMKNKIEKVFDFCKTNNIFFQYLDTPARFYREDKQQVWSNFFNSATTKLIDIHTKREISNNLHYQRQIDGGLVREYVLKNIDFPLTDEYYIAIDSTFSKIWNNKIGIGGYFYWDEISKEIFAELRNKKMLIEFEKADKIVNLMLTYIENYGGFLK